MRMWELRKNNVASDPIAEDELEAMLAAGAVEGSVAVRPVGKEAWKPAFRHAPFAAAASRAPHRVGATLQSAKPPALPPPKDPQRWDQQTQLHMPAQPLPAAAVAAPPPLPQAVTPTPPPPPPEGARTPHIPVVTGPVATVPSMPALSAPAPATAPSPGRAPATGFMAALFDTSFRTFVAPRVAKAFYVVFIIAVFVAMLGGLIAGVVTLAASGTVQSDAGRVLGLLQLVATPIAALILLIVGRMAFESIIVFFRVAEHLAEIDRKTPD